jgi:hypothetical protein
MPEGAIILDRMYFEKPEWLCQAKEAGFSRAAAWLDMLALCNQRATTATVRGIQINLERGECARSKLGLAERWGRSWSWITATLSSWEKDGRIQIRKCDNEMTVIFITNFDAWQTGMLSLLIPERDQKGTKSGAERDQIGTEKEKEKEKYREPRGEGEGEEEPRPGGLPEQTSDEAMLDFARTWPGEMASGTPTMHPDWVTGFLKKINGRNSLPHSWKRLMIATWRDEFRGFKPATGPTPQANGHSGEAIWKKLRDLDAKIKDLDLQIVGFENTQPELAERLEAEVKKLRAERKALADE